MSRPGWPGTPDGWRSTYLPYHASWLIRSSFGSTACNAGACAWLTSRQETTWRRRSWRSSTLTTASTPTPIDGRTPARRLPPDMGHELTPGSTRALPLAPPPASGLSLGGTVVAHTLDKT